MTSVTAIAHPNIALSKYWGKLEGRENVPAVPSLSVTLGGLTTKTTVAFDLTLRADALELDGKPADDVALRRASELLDRVRRLANIEARARIVSHNDFPTASGLASSASGFAALALAATRAARLDMTANDVAALARKSSASAARSVFGGFVELAGEITTQVAPPEAFDIVVLVCVTTEAKKSVSSSDGMKRTAKESPYYSAWLETAPRLHASLKEALLASDLPKAFALAEESALAMHASALAAGVVYVSGVTLGALAEVQRIRAEGTNAYATIDAGPHLKCLVLRKDVALVKARLAAVPGVLRILEASPGHGARILEEPA